MARTRWAVGYARRLITKFRVVEPPVDVETIAKYLKLEVRRENFPDDVSGALTRAPERSVIAVNRNHHENRQRFTIAHELGHYLLHPDAPAYYDGKNQVGVHFRSAANGGGWDPKEIEANRFAAELLMPRRLILNRISVSKTEVDASSLARVFDVSEEAMTYRLAGLRTM